MVIHMIAVAILSDRKKYNPVMGTGLGLYFSFLQNYFQYFLVKFPSGEQKNIY